MLGAAVIASLRVSASVAYTAAFALIVAFRRRKKQVYGVAYDAVTKRPINQANITLIDAKTEKRMQTTITDPDGRYAFFMPAGQPGKFRVQVAAIGHSFPSKIVTARRFDNKYVDLYHGGEIRIGNEGGVISANIPMDPEVPTEAMAKLPVGLTPYAGWLIAAAAVPFITFFSAAAYLDQRLAFMGVIELACFAYLIFGPPRKSRYWGVVFDAKTKKPLANAVVRLFNQQMNKMVYTSQTDAKGRFSFFAGHSDMYIVAEKPGYASGERVPVRVPGMKNACVVVDTDIALAPAAGAPASAV